MTILILAGLFLPQGIAGQYPGDGGIGKDPRVLFAEDFETGTLKEMEKRWGNCGKPENLELTEETHAASPGRRSMRIRFGHLYTHFKGADQVFVRYYTRFDPKCGYTHHLPFLLADATPHPWPEGFAGKRPVGDDFFGSALDAWGNWGTTPPPGKWMLYSYWHEMKADGRGDYWGNNFTVDQEPIERGRWYCVEMTIKANSSPQASDGEQAFWVDGTKVGEFKGIRWRTSDSLKLNSFWLLHDGETGSTINKDAEHSTRSYNVWFDDLVIATEYIGPVSGKKKAGPTAAPDGDLARRAEAIKPRPGEYKWQRIPWILDLNEGIRQAREEKRPILLWVSGDDPLERC